MSTLSHLTSRDAVLKAIEEYDRLGQKAFLRRYGYAKSTGYVLIHEGEPYDSKAVAGVALKYQPGFGRPLKYDEFSGGEKTVRAKLGDLGFVVISLKRKKQATLSADEGDDEPFNPKNAKDAREKVLREIRARRGQRKFRDALVAAYAGRCAITGCAVLDVLEAAHITPYLGPATNHVTNGLLLRADLHTLFDTLLLAVDPDTTKVLVAPTIEDPAYRELDGKPLRATLTKATAPSLEALKQHRAECRW